VSGEDHNDDDITKMTDAEFHAALSAQSQHFREQIIELVRVSKRPSLRHNERNPRNAYIIHEVVCTGCKQAIVQLLDLTLRDGTPCRVVATRKGIHRELIAENVSIDERIQIMQQRKRPKRFEWSFSVMPSERQKVSGHTDYVSTACDCHDYSFTVPGIAGRAATSGHRSTVTPPRPEDEE
jgi:hypothetical protein